MTQSSRSLGAAVLAATAFYVLAANMIAQQGARGTPAPLIGFSTSSFDDSVARLPPSFTGHSIDRAIESLDPPAKGEFETTAEYQKRVPHFSADMKFAFVYSDINRLRPEYSADEAQFDLPVDEQESGPRISGNDDGAQRALIVKRNVDDFSTYSMGNAFGAVVAVQKIRFTFQGIAFRNRGTFTQTRLATFHVDRAAAPTTKPNIGLLFICRAPAEGLRLLRGFRNFPPPSLDNPSDVLHLFQWLSVDLTSVWVFDRKTGTVFKKMDDF